MPAFIWAKAIDIEINTENDATVALCPYAESMQRKKISKAKIG